MEMKQAPLKQQLDIIYRPHPVLPAANCEFKQQTWAAGQTVREALLANGIDPHQLIVVVLDDRLLTVAEWDTVVPMPGQIINVKAEVSGGGDGGSNALQVVAMIALIVVVSYFTMGAGAAMIGLEAGSLGAMAVGAVAMAAGSLVINSVFAANTAANDMGLNGSSGQYSQASPTYSLSGSQNRLRPYESMPVIMGTHRHVPDHGSRPFTEYRGEDQYLYQIFHLGLSTADRSDWRIGTNPITNYSDYSWQEQDANGKINAFPGNVDSTPGATLENASGWITRTTSANTYRIGIDLEGTMYYANNSGGMDTTSVTVRIQYAAAGSGAWSDAMSMTVYGSGFSLPGTGAVVISGNSQAPRRGTLYIDVPTGTYDVRVIRDTADSTDARLQNKTNWSTLRSYQNDEASYIGQNRIGIIIRASEQLNGTIQQMSYLASAYAYYWNGSAWVWGKTSNPAHWLMDFAYGRRNASGKLMYGIGLSADQMDLGALAAWANFCQTEGLTFNAVLDRNQTAADALSAIARCGFASPTWASGKLGVVWDARNALPVMAFGMSNIIRGTFEVSYITENLAEEIIVRYTNPNKDWGQDEVRVMVPGVSTPSRSSTIDLYGCTSEAMAGKFANYMAAQQHYRRRRISWESDFEGFVCQRGDVVMLSHDLTQWGYSGRIVSVNGKTLTLDRTVPRNGSTEFVMLKRPDGSMTTYSVLAGTGESDRIALADLPILQSDALPMDHIWFFSPLPTPGKRVKILSVAPASDSRVKVIATDEDPEFYDAWDGTWNAPPQNTLLLPSTPTVSNVAIREFVYRGAGGNITSSVFVTFIATNFDHANIKWRINNGAWQRLVVFSTEFKIDVEDVGTIEFEILPIGLTTQGTAVMASTYIYGQSSTQPPSDVGNIITMYNGALGGQMVLNWSAIVDFRQPNIQYEVRLGSSWANGKVLGRTPLTQFVAQGDGTYWVAAVYINGGTYLYSASPASVIISGAALQNNVISSVDESVAWTGTLSGGAAIVGGALQLGVTGGIVTNTSGYYTVPNAHIVDAGRATPCNVNMTVNGGGTSTTDNVLSLPDVLSLSDVLQNALGTRVTIQPQIAIGNDSGIYGPWQNFLPGYYNGRYFKFRLFIATSEPSITPVVIDWVVSVDVPDRVDTGKVVTGTSGATTVNYAAPFNGGATGMAIPLVQLTLVDAQAGDDIILTNETLGGFSVRVLNGGATVSRSINWLSQGY